MKRLICLSIFVFFSSIVFGQSGFNPPKINEPLKVESIGIDTVRVADSVRVWHEPYIDSAVSRRIDTTNSILSKLYFETCGIIIPSNYEGYKFDNGVDFGCTGGLPSTTELVDFESNCGSVPLAIPIPMTDQIAVQAYINSYVLPLVASCFAISTNPNDIIYIYDSANDEVQVWYNTNVSPTTLGQYPNNFEIAILGSGSGCDKVVPLNPVAIAPQSSESALLVKICEPLSVTTINPKYNINEIYEVVNSSISFNANTIHSYTITGISGNFDLQEQSTIFAIPSGVTITKTATNYLVNPITVTSSGRTIINIIK